MTTVSPAASRPLRLGKQMQFFGARYLAKALLYAINGGRDGVSDDQIAPDMPVSGEFLDYGDVMAKFHVEWLAAPTFMRWCIHYMHDKYFHERLEMALHDRDILRTMAFGSPAFPVVADSLGAIKYGKMRVTRDDRIDSRLSKRGNKSTAVRQQR